MIVANYSTRDAYAADERDRRTATFADMERAMRTL